MATDRKWTAGAATVVMLVTSSSVVRAEDVDRFVIHLENYVSLPIEQLTAIKGEVDTIFRAAGLSVHWTSALLTRHEDAPGDGVCHLAVVIVNLRTPDGDVDTKSDDVLGRAAPAYRRAWVYANHIATVTERRPGDANVLMARVIAHELGHLLLRSHRHAASGIMQRSVADDAPRNYRFSGDERHRLRDGITACAAVR